MRLKKNVPFAAVPNCLLNDENLSLSAKGIAAYMYSKPDDWYFTGSLMSTQLKADRKTILRYLTELKEAGYLSYTKKSDGTVIYELHNEPKSQKRTQGGSQSPFLPPRQMWTLLIRKI